jgi:hypothetical protein
LRASAVFGALFARTTLMMLSFNPPILNSSIGTLTALGLFATALTLCRFSLRRREIEAWPRPAPQDARSDLPSTILTVFEREP